MGKGWASLNNRKEMAGHPKRKSQVEMGRGLAGVQVLQHGKRWVPRFLSSDTSIDDFELSSVPMGFCHYIYTLKSDLH